MASSRLCSVPDCGKPFNARGLCKTHYELQRRANAAPKPKCLVDSCDKPAQYRGWCSAHHTRWLRHGDTETIKKVANGTVQRYFHEIVLTYSGDDCLTWPFSRDAKGYGVINGHRSKVASRAVCEAAHGEPPTPAHYAAHSCGKGHEGCVNPRHLSWKTPPENKADELIHGTRNFGERNGQARLTAKQVKEIRGLLGTMSQAKIAKIYGIHQVQISKINKRQIWAWLD